ncbi:MAG TPA: AAA family ATPase [Coriobacteriia bacterium]|nr:AAA family ATPase [Coriobacteriia bacterium]
MLESVAAHRIQTKSSLETLGTDLGARRSGDSALFVRRELAQHVVSLLQSGTNVLLRGPSGVGKTELARSLPLADWQRIIPSLPGQLALVESRPIAAPLIVETNGSKFIEDCQFCHDLENKMAWVLKKAIDRPAILFIDPIESCLGAGAASSDPHSDVANLLVPFVDRGLRVLAATTPAGEQLLRGENERLHSRFLVVDVPSPDEAETRQIAQLRLEYLRSRGAVVQGGALESGLELARRYFPSATPLAGFAKLARGAAAREGEIGPASLRTAVAHELGVRPCYAGAAVAPTFGEIAARVGASVFGQEAAVEAMADALCRYSAGMVEADRPVAAFLAAGPTGCGKTSLALAVAEEFTGSADNVVRVDMAEYSDPYSARRLLTEDAGSVFSRLASRPAGVLLLDEVEKANPAVLLTFLSALGEGRLTSVDGRTLRLDHYVVLLTTNVGGRRWSLRLPESKTTGLVLADIADAFSPEFRARMTRTLVFKPLSEQAGAAIVSRELDRLNAMPGLVERALQIVWSDALPNALSAVGVSVEKGARGVQSVVRALVASPLARWLAEHPEAGSGLVMVAPRLEGGRLVSLAVDWVDEGGFFAGLPN